MKYLIPVLLLLTGCASVGKILQGAGQGLTNVSQAPANQPVNCTSQVTGSLINTNCQ